MGAFSWPVRNDLSIYETHADEWWNPRSHFFRSLQRMTPFRMGLIIKWFGDVQGKEIVDFGCGGGLLSVPLLERGARVTGIDVSPASVRRAGLASVGRGAFMCADIRAVPLLQESADFAVLADVIDHIPDYPLVLQEISRVLRPGGKLFLSTINRTLRAWVLAIVLGEGLELIPRGTHDYDLFVRPEELCAAARNSGLRPLAITGDCVNYLRTLREWAIVMHEGSDTSVSYSMLLARE